jgi:leader peptidase (prepilin peptidase)/N-methyltransferase
MNCWKPEFRTVEVMTTPAVVRKYALHAATAALFGLAIWRLGLSPELPAVLAFIFGGVLLSVIDWKVKRLPTELVYYTLAGVGAGLVFASFVEREWVPLVTAIAGGLLFANAFFLIWMFTTKYAGMKIIGLGDVRLAAVLGLLLGWYGLQYVLYGAILGHLLAFAIAIATSVRQRQLQVTYSFGPPLIAGTLAVVLFYA